MKCTVVSLLPYPLREVKPGLFPGEFAIPACLNEKPGILHVDRSRHDVYLDEKRGSIPVWTPSDEIARALIYDYRTSCLAVEEDAIPGLFWLEGEKSLKDIGVAHVKELNDHQKKQENWFERLVKLADDDWERLHKHSAISNLQRLAAKSLNLERPWIVVKPSETRKCPACRTTVEFGAVICSACHCVLDAEGYKKLTFTVSSQIPKV